MNDGLPTSSAITRVAPRWFWPILVGSALVLGYGAAERAVDWSESGSSVRGLAAVGYAALAVFNLAAAVQLFRRRE